MHLKRGEGYFRCTAVSFDWIFLAFAAIIKQQILNLQTVITLQIIRLEHFSI